MPYLKLSNAQSGEVLEFTDAEVRIGRSSNLEMVIEGPQGGVVSGSHARMTFRDGGWVVEDLGSTNGTYLDQQQLVPGHAVPLTTGSTLGFGLDGPRFMVEEALAGKLEAVVEAALSAGPLDETVPMNAVDGTGSPLAPSSAGGASQVTIVLKDSGTSSELRGVGARLRIGRGRECELRPVEQGDTTVSRVHAEIVLKLDRRLVIRDARSRNGTMVNGVTVASEHELAVGDRIKLGHDGPEFLVTSIEGALVAQPRVSVSPTPVPGQAEPSHADPEQPAQQPRRSFYGRGRTVFMRELVEETTKKSSATLRKVIWGFTVLFAGGVGGLYWYSEQRARETTVLLEAQRQAIADQRAIADSMQNAAGAEYERLREDLDQARAGSAPSAVVDSLRVALVEAQRRTDALEQSLGRARGELDQQLAEADSQRRIREAELTRLRSEVDRASSSAVPQGLLDSLRRAMSNAESQLDGIEDRVQAVRSSDLAAVAQANQGAVGLVSSFIGGSIFDGSGFALTASGYFLTNRHVVVGAAGAADSVFVTMADERRMRRADVIAIPPQRDPDIALLKIRNYNGPYVPRVDWEGNKAQQGDPAALIGFPAGLAAALDRTQTIRTSLSGGFFSQVTADEIRFDGFTVGGSSGSPILTAAGDVVAIHRAGLSEAAGLSFAVPVRRAIPFLPAAARAELRIR